MAKIRVETAANDPADVQEMVELLACCPRIIPTFMEWAGARVVSDARMAQLERQCETERRAYMSTGPYLDFWFMWVGEPTGKTGLTCGAITGRGEPCRGRTEPGKKRCKFHGGRSTGPRTPEGRAKIAESNRRRKKHRVD